MAGVFQGNLTTSSSSQKLHIPGSPPQWPWSEWIHLAIEDTAQNRNVEAKPFSQDGVGARSVGSPGETDWCLQLTGKTGSLEQPEAPPFCSSSQGHGKELLDVTRSAEVTAGGFLILVPSDFPHV